MNFLNELGFSKEELKLLKETTPKVIQTEMEENNEVVTSNVNFLKELGVTNFKEIVITYSEMFLMDNTNFKNIFLKYDKADLVEKLAKNISIIEYL